MRLSELVSQLKAEPDLADLTERQVRFMQGEGFVPPAGGTRASPEYGDEHIEAIRRYERLRRMGFKPSAIKVIYQGGGPLSVEVVPGVTLTVDPSALDRPVEEIAAALVSTLNDIVPRPKSGTAKTEGDAPCT